MNNLLPILILLLSSCSFEGEKSTIEHSNQNVGNSLNDEICFKSSDLSNTEFIHISLNNNNIVGELYTYDEYFGEVLYSFTGELISDGIVTVKMYVLNDIEPTTETLKYHFNGSLLVVNEDVPEKLFTNYKFTNCSEMPDKANYATIEDIAAEELGEYLENLFPTYYESISPNSMQHNGGLHEYFQLLEVLDTLTGFGVGIADGEPMWEFDFTGSIVNDSVYLVNVNYRQEGYEPVSTQEEWKYNYHTAEFLLGGYNRPKNGRRYVPIDLEDLPDFIRDRLQQINLELP